MLNMMWLVFSFFLNLTIISSLLHQFQTSEDKMRFWYKQAPIPFEKESLPLKKLHFKNGKRLCLQVRAFSLFFSY